MDLTSDTVVEENMQQGRDFCFSVITRSRTYLFEAKNKAEMDVWMSAIAHNISGLR